MTEHRQRISALVFALTLCLLTIVGIPTAAAQGGLATPPPVFTAVDGNNVDLLRGQLNTTSAGLSIGQPGAGGLSFSQNFIGSGWRHTFVGTINRASSGSRGPGIPIYTVSFGSISEEFRSIDGVNYFPIQDGGSSLSFDSGTQRYTFTSSTGVVAIFDKNLANSGMPWNANEGRLISTTSPSGEVVTYHYASATVSSTTRQRLQSVTNNLGYQIHFDYANNVPANSTELNGPWQQIIAVTAINNAVDYCAPTAATCTGMSQTWPSLTFTVSGSYETITDAEGRATRYTYSGGLITAIRRPTSTSADNLTFTYTSGKVTGVSNSSETWTYAYSDVAGVRTTTVTDPLSHTRVIVSNILTGLVTSDTNGLSQTYAYQHDSDDRVTRITAPEGNYFDYEYDARGNLIEVTAVAKSGSGLSNIVTTATYPSTCSNIVTCNQPTSTTDALGNTTDYTYDATHGGVLTITAPEPSSGADRPQTRFAYDQFYAWYKDNTGAIAQAPSAVYRPTEISACAVGESCDATDEETLTTISYGSSGVANNRLPTSISTGAGDNSLTATRTTTYDAIGNALTINGPLSGSDDTTRYRYNAVRQIVGVVGPDPDGAGGNDHRAVRITYNADGQTTMVEQGTVDSQSDPDWANFVSLQQRNSAYDFIGRLTQQTLTASSTTYSVVQSSYDDANRLQCAVVRMNPAIFGALPGSACALGTEGGFGPDRITRQTYDAANRVTQVTIAYATPNPINEWSATYTTNGQMATLTDANGNLTTYEYDGFDRLRKLRFPNPSSSGSSTTDYEQYSYNASSNLTQLRRRDATTLDYEYDDLLRVIEIDASSNGPDTTYTYDNFGRVLTAAIPGQTLTNTYDALSRQLTSQSPLGTVTYQWDLASRRTRLTWPDSFYAVYDYDLTGALTAIRENGATSGPGVLVEYEYDALGRRVLTTRGNGTSEIAAFDGASRLAELTQDLASTADDLTIEYDHNPAGGIVARDLSNSAYAWTPPSPATTNYAANNLNQYTSVGGAAQAFDARGNLTTGGYGYDIFNRLVSGPSSATLAYDPAGRLYETVGGATTRFLYDGVQMIAEYNSSNVLQRRYVPGTSLDDVIAWYEGSGTSDRRWLAADERGSVIAIANASGTASNINTYDEYGIRGASNVGRFQYTGQAWLTDVALYHYRARAYSPELGRFMQTDPIGVNGGVNLYAYVGNDPMTFVDPFGTQSIPHGPVLPLPEPDHGETTVTAIDDQCSEYMVVCIVPPSAPLLQRRNTALAQLGLGVSSLRPVRRSEPNDDRCSAWSGVEPTGPSEWDFTAGSNEIAALITGVAIFSSYNIATYNNAVANNGSVIANACGPSGCAQVRQGFVSAGDQVTQRFVSGNNSPSGLHRWRVFDNGAIPEAGGDLGGAGIVSVSVCTRRGRL